MKRKIKLSILSFLSFVSMFSVGFASWTITGGSSSNETTSSIAVDKVERPTLVTINITEELQYFGNGFVDGGNDLKATAIINLDNCVSYLLEDDVTSCKLAVKVSLDYVSGITKDNYLISLADLEIKEKEGITVLDDTVYINIDNTSSGAVSFDITYTFNISDSDKDNYFKEGSILFNNDVFVILGEISVEREFSTE